VRDFTADVGEDGLATDLSPAFYRGPRLIGLLRLQRRPACVVPLCLVLCCVGSSYIASWLTRTGCHYGKEFMALWEGGYSSLPSHFKHLGSVDLPQEARKMVDSRTTQVSTCLGLPFRRRR
jgi:hypothetical protein